MFLTVIIYATMCPIYIEYGSFYFILSLSFSQFTIVCLFHPMFLRKIRAGYPPITVWLSVNSFETTEPTPTTVSSGNVPFLEYEHLILSNSVYL